MNKKEKCSYIVDTLNSLYPNTQTFLHFKTDWQLLFAIILSAQATDQSVNQATEKLFSNCPDLKDYQEGNRTLILQDIKTVGLGKSKAEYLIKTAQILIEKYQGKVPTDRNKLMELPGVGYKTSGVFLAEFYQYPFIPVDTHIYRVTHRLGIVKDSSNPDATEKELEKIFFVPSCIHLHRQLILFGRNICDSRNPKCTLCPFHSFCKFYQNKKSTK